MQGTDVMKYRSRLLAEIIRSQNRQSLKQMDIREDKVAELKAKVNSGNYFVDTADFAKKLLEKYNTSLM